MSETEHASKIFKIPELNWKTFTLSQQFILTGGLVVMLGMLFIGFWVARQIEDGVTRNAAVTTALYVDSFISPLTIELETADTLSVGPIRALDEVFLDSPLGNRLMSVKIWKPNGLIVYSSDIDLIGKKFTPTEELMRATSGEVVAGFDSLDGEEDANERALGLPLLEIYSPIRAPWSGKIIAIAEFYENGTELKSTLASARLQSWLIVAFVMASMASLLMIIVHRGSKTIDQQRNTLQTQLAKVTKTSEQNQKLKNRVQVASERVTELNERFLKRTSAELHDGPAQLLSFAVLRLGEVKRENNKELRDAELSVIQTALDDAMLDIRNVCKGLSLPDIYKLSVQDIVKKVSRAYNERTGLSVDQSVTQVEINVPKAVKICIYRFVQEALNNVWKHAEGSIPVLVCAVDTENNLLSVTVKDNGPGFDMENKNTQADSLGLGGLRERVRSIGGELLITSALGQGTTLAFQVSLAESLNTEGKNQ